MALAQKVIYLPEGTIYLAKKELYENVGNMQIILEFQPSNIYSSSFR